MLIFWEIDEITMESTLLDPANLEGAKGKETRILGELLLSFPVFPLHVVIG